MNITPSMIGRLEVQTAQAYDALRQAVDSEQPGDVSWSNHLYRALEDTLNIDTQYSAFLRRRKPNPLDRYCLQYVVGNVVPAMLGRKLRGKNITKSGLQQKLIDGIDQGVRYKTLRSLAVELCGNGEFRAAVDVLHYIREAIPIKCYVVSVNGIAPVDDESVTIYVPGRYEITIASSEEGEKRVEISSKSVMAERCLDHKTDHPTSSGGSQVVKVIDLREQDVRTLESLSQDYRAMEFVQAMLMEEIEQSKEAMAKRIASFLHRSKS